MSSRLTRPPGAGAVPVEACGDLEADPEWRDESLGIGLENHYVKVDTM